MATVNAPQRVQSVARAAELLKALGAGGGDATVFDLADRCGLNRSTAWRILATLEESGLVERDPRTGRYSAGYALVALAAAPPPPRAPRSPRPPRGPATSRSSAVPTRSCGRSPRAATRPRASRC